MSRPPDKPAMTIEVHNDDSWVPLEGMAATPAQRVLSLGQTTIARGMDKIAEEMDELRAEMAELKATHLTMCEELGALKMWKEMSGR